MKTLFAYIRPYRWSYGAAIACALGSQTSTLAGPWIVGRTIDGLRLGMTGPALLTACAQLVLVAGSSGLLRYIARRILLGRSRDVEYDIRLAFFQHLQRLSLDYFQRQRTGDLMARAASDLTVVRALAGQTVMDAINTLAMMATALTGMLITSPRLALMTLVPLPFAVWAVRRLLARMQAGFASIQERFGELTVATQEAVGRVRLTRAYCQESTALGRIERANAAYLGSARTLIAANAWFGSGSSFVNGLGALLMIWLGAREALAGRLTVGELSAFSMYYVWLNGTLLSAGWLVNAGQRGLASWKRIREVLDVVPDIADGATAAVLRPPVPGPRASARVELRDLRFGYGERSVLQGISAVFEPGETVALFGPIGSGKSTIVSLLVRLRNPAAGTILLDGVDLLDLPLATLRRRVALVSQDAHLFSDTLENNIALGLDALASRPGEHSGPHNPETRRAHVRAAATAAGLAPEIARFPQGYDTPVGERGVTLSGGQRQRVAIARALARTPDLLILDDALSGVDAATEDAVLTGLRGRPDRPTIVLVSHRTSTVRHADRILVLSDGCIVEAGSHHELLARESLYATLCRRQELSRTVTAGMERAPGPFA